MVFAGNSEKDQNRLANETDPHTKINLNVEQEKGTISRYIYGHFAEHLGRGIYDGFWVGHNSPIPNIGGLRTDIIKALRRLHIPVLRWPGGCFADEYHWKDGVGPAAQRRPMLNTHWGGVVETNLFGTHEFFQLCQLLECEPYICGNVGSGTVQEMQEWIEYLTSDAIAPMPDWRRQNGQEESWRLRFFGVGNESWGCGGNMRPEYYADVYRRYQTYVRNYGENKLYKIACGANAFDYEWTEVLMQHAAKYMDGLSLHYYTVPGDWQHKGSATDFTEEEWFITLKKALMMEELVTKHSAIMDRYDPAKRIGLILDEWGTWYDVEPDTNPGFLYQQNSLRDALVAGVTLNIFNNHADRVQMANLAQTVNVLQALILTEGDKLILTPTYHVFDLYQVHQDATLIETTLESAGDYVFEGESLTQISVSASKDKAGRVNVTLCNIDSRTAVTVSLRLTGATALSQVSGKVLSAATMNTHNTFSQPETLKLVNLSISGFDPQQLLVELEPMSVTLLTIE